jgi:hemerythrin-like domain-containing protein
MLAAWEALRPSLQQLAQGTETALSPSLTENFIRSYTEHIRCEEAELLPLAARLLSQQHMTLIGINMAARRGTKLPATPPD